MNFFLFIFFLLLLLISFPPAKLPHFLSAETGNRQKAEKDLADMQTVVEATKNELE
jgi:hypothetical protein